MPRISLLTNHHQIFNRFDVDNSRELDFDEFTALVRELKFREEVLLWMNGARLCVGVGVIVNVVLALPMVGDKFNGVEPSREV